MTDSRAAQHKLPVKRRHMDALVAWLTHTFGNEGSGWHRVGDAQFAFDREEDRRRFAAMALKLYKEVSA